MSESFIRSSIKTLLSNTRNLTTEEVTCTLNEIMLGKATQAQIAAFLVAFQTKILTPEILSACANSILSFSIPFQSLALHTEPVLDIVGTGGDLHDTFNASTASALVCAATGLKVAKHGNRSSSGRCGAADLIEALGVDLDLPVENVENVLSQIGFAFLFAPKFHPAMANVAPVRKEIGVRTIFNALGPLVNPARPTHMLIGVGSITLGEIYAKVCLERRIRAMIVHSTDGLDEITTNGETLVWDVKPDGCVEFKLHPDDFGLSVHPISEILGSLPKENAQIFLKILKGEETGGVYDFVLLNAGAALYVAEKALNLKHGVQLAKEVIDSGKALKFLENYVREVRKETQNILDKRSKELN